MTAELTHFIRGYQDFCSDQGQPSKAAMFAKVIDVLNRADLSPLAAMPAPLTVTDAARVLLEGSPLLTAFFALMSAGKPVPKSYAECDEVICDTLRAIAGRCEMTHPKEAVDISREAVEAAWEDYCQVGTSENTGGMELYDIEGMNEEAFDIYQIAIALRAALDLKVTQGEEALECINALKDSRDAMQAALDRAEADKAAAVEAAAQIAQDKSSKLLAKADRVKGGRWRSVSSPCTDGFSPSRG